MVSFSGASGDHRPAKSWPFLYQNYPVRTSFVLCKRPVVDEWNTQVQACNVLLSVTTENGHGARCSDTKERGLRETEYYCVPRIWVYSKTCESNNESGRYSYKAAIWYYFSLETILARYPILVSTTQVNSAFRAIWLVPLSRDIKYYSPPGGFRRKKCRARPISSENKVTIWELLLNLCCIY